MSSVISPKAEISPRAKIGDGCKIFPFVYIEDDVVIGDNCVIFPFVSILNGTRMGNGNKVHQGSVLAALPQDFNFVGEKSTSVMIPSLATAVSLGMVRRLLAIVLLTQVQSSLLTL